MENLGVENIESGKTKHCKKCDRTLPLSDFYKRTGAKDGRAHWCKSCTRANVLEWQKKFVDRANEKANQWKREHKEQVRSFNAVYRERNRDRLRSQNKEYARQKRATMSFKERQVLNRKVDLKRKYGITVEEYDAKLIAQDGRCAICNAPVSPKRALANDHSHETGDNRGLLCGHCNPLLHKLETMPGWIEAAAAYLEQYRRPTCT